MKRYLCADCGQRYNNDCALHEEEVYAIGLFGNVEKNENTSYRIHHYGHAAVDKQIENQWCIDHYGNLKYRWPVSLAVHCPYCQDSVKKTDCLCGRGVRCIAVSAMPMII